MQLTNLTILVAKYEERKRRRKSELVKRDFPLETLEELSENVAERVEYWNRKRRHQSIANRIPMEFLEEES